MSDKPKKYRLLKDWATPWGAVRAGTIYVKGVNCYVPAFPQQVAQLAISHPYDYPDWFAPVEPEPWRPRPGTPYDWMALDNRGAYVLNFSSPPDVEELSAGRIYPPGKGQAVADEINAILQKRCREHSS